MSNLPDTPKAILFWAATHIERVGLYLGPELFGGPGRTVDLPCWPRGAVEVATGEGRAREYRDGDHAQRVWSARDETYFILAEYLTGYPGVPPHNGHIHRFVLDQWSSTPGLTATEVARKFREVAVSLGEAGK